MNAGKLVSDETVNQIVLDALSSKNKDGFILDGYPRTIEQAKFLHQHFVLPNRSPILAINITLDRDVTIQKLLGRRFCRTCGGSFNIASIMDRGFDMPAILPNSKNCPFFTQGKCEPQMVKRNDDTHEVIEVLEQDSSYFYLKVFHSGGEISVQIPCRV